jgi:transcriptional regulator with XRE-family HTH domain
VALRSARLEMGLTQEQLAEMADFKPSYISMLENAERQPTITALVAFEQAMNLDAGELTQRTVTAMKGKRLVQSHPRKSRKVR